MTSLTDFESFMWLYRAQYTAALARTLDISIAAATALALTFARHSSELGTLHVLMGCSRGQAVAAAVELERRGLANIVEAGTAGETDPLLVPRDDVFQAVRHYQLNLEQLLTSSGLHEVLEESLPRLQQIFHEALLALKFDLHTLADGVEDIALRTRREDGVVTSGITICTALRSTR